MLQTIRSKIKEAHGSLTKNQHATKIVIKKHATKIGSNMCPRNQGVC